MNCDSNERGVSSPFYLLSLQQKLVVYFYNGVCQCDSIQKESLLSPDVANPAEDLIAHSAKKREEQSNIPPKNSLTPPRRRHLRASVIKWGWTSPCGGAGGRKQPPCNKKSVCI